MLGLFNSSSKSKKIVILHIGSSSVGGSIVSYVENKKIEILTSFRVPANFLQDVNFESFWRCIKESVRKMIADLRVNLKGRPDMVVCIFSSPWFVSQTKTASVRREEFFNVEQKLLDKILENEKETFLHYWQGHMETTEGKANILEEKIMEITLNGYPTQKPIGKSAKSLTASVYISLGIKEVKDFIKNESERIFGNVPVYFNTLPFVVFNVMNNMVNNSDGYLFMEIGGETTEISLVKKNILQDNISFAKGRNFLARKIASEFKTTIDDGKTILESYEAGHSKKEVADKVSGLIKQISDDWFVSFQESLKIIAEKSPLPQNFFIIGNDRLDKYYIEYAKNPELKRYTIFDKPFSVKYILPEMLSQYFDASEESLKNKDIFLIMETVFASKFLK